MVVLLAALLLTVALPPVAPAQLTCHTNIGITVSPAEALAVGDTMTVVLALGAGNIQGGSKVTINRLRYELACKNSLLRVPCPDQGDSFTYLGDATIMTDCPVAWSSNAPAGGNVPNEIIFTPSSSFDVLSNTPRWCSLWFDIGVDKTGPTTPPAVDGMPGLTEVIAGFSAVDADAECDNGVASPGAEAVAIKLLSAPVPRQRPIPRRFASQLGR
jgi:hypothetical protein